MDALVLWLALGVVFTGIWYMVIKAAVKNGILEAMEERDNPREPEDRISMTVCPSCQKKHEMDYPKCPHCGHRYVE